MESQPPVGSNILEDCRSRSQVASNDDSLPDHEMPESELTTGSPRSFNDRSNAALALLMLKSASGPTRSSLDRNIDGDLPRQPTRPDANCGRPHPHAEGSRSPPNSLKENKERKTRPDLPDYNSQDNYSPGHLLESKHLSQEAKAYPDLPDYTSSSSSRSPCNSLKTETSGSDDEGPEETENSGLNNSGPNSDLDDDRGNSNLDQNVPDSDLDHIRQTCINVASRRCPETQNDEQITDTVGGSESVVPADSILGNESSTEIGTDPGTPEGPMDCSPSLSPPRPRQAVEMAPGLTIPEDHPRNKSALSLVNRSPSQEPGPSGASQELAASIGVVARPWNSSSSKHGVAHLPVKKSESPPIETSKEVLKDYPDLADYTSSSSDDGNPDSDASGPNSVEDMSLPAKPNWRKWLKGVPEIALAEGTSSD